VTVGTNPYVPIATTTDYNNDTINATAYFTVNGATCVVATNAPSACTTNVVVTLNDAWTNQILVTFTNTSVSLPQLLLQGPLVNYPETMPHHGRAFPTVEQGKRISCHATQGKAGSILTPPVPS